MDDMHSRPERIVNLLSAVLVLLAGFYVVIFLPLPVSPGGRIAIGALVLLYFLWRVKYFVWRYGRREKSVRDRSSDRNKIA
ncbi:MAG: hypothetical protein JSV44_12275 [Candidatus Zixiibacteriota bacterium]|nr:MAG: hypothetical protein JSV44_12275 [candidate division Zixibacteria bacterium]